MPDESLARRLITVTSVIVMFVAISALSPLLLIGSALFDSVRLLIRRRPAITTRLVAFLWVYLLGELWAVLALGLTALLPHRPRLAVTYRLQDLWAGWNLTALCRLFSVDVEVEGEECLMPGPIVVLSRHASIVDTLLPARLVAHPTGLRLRYVLKRELLVDPALDIAGNRLPNVFIDRSSRQASERETIESLATGLGPEDGILIYPEGTRFTPEKLRRIQERMGDDARAGRGRLQRVLPPKPGGTLAILDATTADVVILAHHGLEGLATVADIWRGHLVGTTVKVRLWRVLRCEIPAGRDQRVEWLNEIWAEIDRWIVASDTRQTGG